MDTLIYTPLYNLMVLIMNIVPGLDLGLYIILFTLVVKVALVPLSIKAIKSQQEIKVLQPKVKALQEKHKKDREVLGVKLMELYKEHEVNPFASFGLILVQIPIIFGLYYIVLRAGLPDIDPTILYSFVSTPATDPSSLIFGAINVVEKSLPFALAAGITQYVQTTIALPSEEDAEKDSKEKVLKSGKAAKVDPQEMMQSVTGKLKYIFPVIITVIAYTLSAAVGLYFITSNLFQIAQELYVKSKGIKDQTGVAYDI